MKLSSTALAFLLFVASPAGARAGGVKGVRKLGNSPGNSEDDCEDLEAFLNGSSESGITCELSPNSFGKCKSYCACREKNDEAPPSEKKGACVKQQDKLLASVSCTGPGSKKEDGSSSSSEGEKTTTTTRTVFVVPSLQGLCQPL